jgi:hypothetical protein
VTLQSIVDNPTPKQSVFGVILDVTGAYKTYDSIDYVTKLKIIDNTFNHKDNITNYKSFIHVFIYSDTPEIAPRAARIGDIIKLSNFDVRCFYRSSGHTRTPRLKPCTIEASPTGLFLMAERLPTLA